MNKELLLKQIYSQLNNLDVQTLVSLDTAISEMGFSNIINQLKHSHVIEQTNMEHSILSNDELTYLSKLFDDCCT
ncbi:hypothetical protein QF117_11270 [Vibrio sp. YMD68]|uniref:hypothetical protein n=1 Tax=Vibrio sp. YMD68 TaxID=3042300 RepID=UPI00249BE9A2|nr:hypothetical protein [Vibrio sp. YMD68]WGW01362.1 hypothetical protein QF117_11270 [Vibrio sp. YMD68]